MGIKRGSWSTLRCGISTNTVIPAQAGIQASSPSALWMPDHIRHDGSLLHGWRLLRNALDFSELWAPFLVQHGFKQSDDPRDVLVWHFVYELRRPFP